MLPNALGLVAQHGELFHLSEICLNLPCHFPTELWE